MIFFDEYDNWVFVVRDYFPVKTAMMCRGHHHLDVSFWAVKEEKKQAVAITTLYESLCSIMVVSFCISKSIELAVEIRSLNFYSYNFWWKLL